MAKTTKKAAKKTNPKPRAASSADSVSKLKKTIAALGREMREAAEQQAATSDILRMIARAPADLQVSARTRLPESAARLCDAADAVVWRVDGDVLAPRCAFWTYRRTARPLRVGTSRLLADSPNSRAVVDRQTVHVHDLPKPPSLSFLLLQTSWCCLRPSNRACNAVVP